MAVHVFVFLLVSFLLFCLARLWRLDWFRLGPSSSPGGVKRTRLHCLLNPRCPLDCPACRLASTTWPGVRPAPALVRPWSEVKSRRGAPKRIDTKGFACPNRMCLYFGITDAQIYPLVVDGKHGHVERIQTFRCQACRTTFSARRHTPLYQLKTPSQQIAVVLSSLAEGLDLSAFDKPPLPPGCRVLVSTRKSCMSASSAICTSRTCSWMNCAPGCAAPHRCSGWPLIPSRRFFLCFSSVPEHNTWPITSSIPCERSWPPFCIPVFTSDGLNVYFYALPGPFWTVAPGGSERAESASVAGGSEADLRAGKETLPAA